MRKTIQFRATLVFEVLFLVFIGFSPVMAQSGDSDSTKSRESGDDIARSGGIEPKLSVTRHTFRLGEESFGYTATAGYLRLKDDSAKPKADLFFTAYTVENQESRAITFVFNGGPGASSVWLHLGVAGPVRVLTGEDAAPAGPPYATVPNPYSWLPWTDLVFIDPVGTGFSRAIPPEESKAFYGTRDDVKWIGEFIRSYVSMFGRWKSPKCIAGESYGALRAAGLLKYLYETHGMEFEGLLLISPALDLDTILFSSTNDLPYVLFFPSYTAAAWYHGKIAPELRDSLPLAIAEAEEWAIEEYLPALARGDLLPEAERDRLAEQFARFTGLPEKLVSKWNLRVSREDFTSELLRSEGLSIGFMDGRRVQSGMDEASFLHDPGMAATYGPYSGAINEYLSNQLGFTPGIPYVTFSRQVNSQWNWGSAVGQADAVETIRNALNRNKRLKILAAAGYFDLDVPYFATTYVISHLRADPRLHENISVSFFRGGHMFYTSNEALESFSREAAVFFKKLQY